MHIVDLGVDASVDICVASCFILVRVVLDPRRTASYSPMKGGQNCDPPNYPVQVDGSSGG